MYEMWLNNTILLFPPLSAVHIVFYVHTYIYRVFSLFSGFTYKVKCLCICSFLYYVVSFLLLTGRCYFLYLAYPSHGCPETIHKHNQYKKLQCKECHFNISWGTWCHLFGKFGGIYCKIKRRGSKPICTKLQENWASKRTLQPEKPPFLYM